MFVALDVATRCGYAQWAPGWVKPIYGTWILPGEVGEVGRKAVTLHRRLSDLHALSAITSLTFEGGIPSNALGGHTNMSTLYLLAALSGHVESFAYAVNARCRNVPQASWRKHFIGKGSGFKSKDFKAMSIARCREIGWSPHDDNASDALGVLDYTLHLAGVETPWQQASVFGAARL